MNQQSENMKASSDSQIKESQALAHQEENCQITANNQSKDIKTTASYLPSSLLKDLNTSSDEEEEESEEEQDVVYFNEELNSNKNFPWGNKLTNTRKLKAPSKKGKDKFFSLDDIQSLKLFQFQKMKQNQMMFQYQVHQQQQQQQKQQQLLYANQHRLQPFQLNNYHHPSQFYHHHQSPQMQMHPQQNFSGNYMVPPFMGMHQPKQMTDISDAFTKKQKTQISFGDKVLNNPKRILSSPASWFQNPLKKKKEKKKSIDDNFQTLEELLKFTNGDLYSFIIMQKGSREVQKLLYKITLTDLNTLVNHLSNRLSDLMIDKYANYFCQKLIQNCSPELRIQVIKSIKDKFIEISCNSFGTHSLQTLIEIANMPSEHEVLRQCVETGVMALALDSKGTHVLQKFIVCCHENQQGAIPLTLLDHFDSLIKDSHGVCVLIKFVQNSSNKQLKERLISLIAENALEIIQNPFGNYVVQSLFKESDIDSCKDILKVIVDNFFSLSMQKFSSNVVESILGLADQETLKQLLNEIINGSKLGSMVKNTYGNFVIEKMIAKMDSEGKKILFQELQNLGKDKDKGIISSLSNLLSQ